MDAKFVASYEDYEKSKVLARKEGWTEDDGGLLDFLNGDPPRARQTFPTQPEAEAWLRAEIGAEKTMFGCGDIDVFKQPKRRCKYCTCNGWLRVQSFIVEDTGVTEERDLSEECWDGEE